MYEYNTQCNLFHNLREDEKKNSEAERVYFKLKQVAKKRLSGTEQHHSNDHEAWLWTSNYNDSEKTSDPSKPNLEKYGFLKEIGIIRNITCQHYDS